MLVNNRKLRNRNQKFKSIFLFVTAVLMVSGAGVSISWFTMHPKDSYISPLAKDVLSATFSEDESDIKLLKKSLDKKQISTSAISPVHDTYVIQLQEGGEVIFSSQKDIDSQISSLQFILSRLTMEGRQVRHLDLRFDKPVIVFEK